MVSFKSAFVFATALFAAIGSAQPIDLHQAAKRDYAVKNPANNNNGGGNVRTVTVTVYQTQAPPRYQHNGDDEYNVEQPTYSAEQPSYNAQPPAYSAGSGWKNQMLQKVNEVRARAGRGPVALREELNAMAQQQSDYQNRIQTMTHDNPGGGLGDRISKYGLKWSGLAENVAVGQKDVDQVMDAWIKSSGHYKNMVGDYDSVGFGETNLYWTQDFAKFR